MANQINPHASHNRKIKNREMAEAALILRLLIINKHDSWSRICGIGGSVLVGSSLLNALQSPAAAAAVLPVAKVFAVAGAFCTNPLTWVAAIVLLVGLGLHCAKLRQLQRGRSVVRNVLKPAQKSPD